MPIPRHRRSRVTVALAASLALGVVSSFVAAGVAGAAAPSAAAGSAHAAKATATATLAIIKPNVTVERKGKSVFKPAKDGQKLRVGDTVQTDATGFAQVNYTDDSFTRLDINTTFTIVSLSDDQGNRQIKSSVDAGRTWNRTSALTESESFEQEGAGATAAVVGSAFMLEFTSPGNGTFTSLIDGLKLTTVDGEVQQLAALETCASHEISASDANLCDAISQLTMDAILANQWILENLFLDGLAGFQGIVVVENGHVVSFTPTPADQPTTPPAPQPACGTAPTDPPIHFDGSPGTGAPPSTLGTCAMTAFGDDTRTLGEDVTTVDAPGGGAITFSTALNHREIGEGLGWGTWSHGYTGDVYFLDTGVGGLVTGGAAATAASSMTITLPTGTVAFSFYAEPNSFGDFLVTATAQDGTTSNPTVTDGEGGAKYFGFYTTSSASPLLSITVSCDDASGFAVGEFGISRAGSSTTSSLVAEPAPAVVSEPEPAPAESATPEAAPAPDPPAAP